MNSPKPTIAGRVELVVPEEEYAIIRSADGREFWFHRTALRQTDFSQIKPGVRVEFRPSRHSSGDIVGKEPRAVNVRLAGER